MNPCYCNRQPCVCPDLPPTVCWETKAIDRAKEIIKTPEWKAFREGLAVYVEDFVRDKVNGRFVDTELTSQGLYEQEGKEDAEFEFGMTMEGELSRHFLRHFVNNYAGGLK